MSEIAPATDSEGVVYRSDDYLGFARRVLIDAVDFPVAFVLVVLVFVAAEIAAGLPQDRRTTAWIFACSVFSVALLYFVVLKRSRFRTLGYIVAGARVVDLQGGTPSAAALFVRLLFGAMGPMNLLVDFLWITSDPCRQALRDKFAGTYVVRRDAAPSGRGRIVRSTYTILGASFLFHDVQVRSGQPAA